MMMKFKKFILSDYFYQIILLVPILVYLIIAMHIPVTVNIGAVHDDGLFYRLSKNIVSGQWLGEYNNLTLAKGSGFSIILAINAILGIPITLFLALVYASACYFLTSFCISQNMPKFLAFFMFILVLFHPAIFPLKIVRDNIYPALTLLSFIGIASIIFGNKQFNKTYVFFSGLIFGLFLITREEWVWVIPGISILLLFGIYFHRKQPFLKSLLSRLGLFLLSGVLVVNIISIVNFSNYGIYKDVDFKEKEFQAVLKNLNSVEISHEIPFFPVPKERREVLYGISPSFSELKDFFESTGKGWTEYGCRFYPESCGDYAGGWFMWALRDAVASKGYYRSANEATAFYKKLNNEITSACKDNKIKCKKNIIPFMPNITGRQWMDFPKSFYKAINMSAWDYGYNIPSPPSADPQGNLFSYKILLGNPKSTPGYDVEKISRLNGWFYSPKHTWFFLHCDGNDGKKIIYPKRLKSPDIANYFKDPNANYQRFSFSIPNEDCFISSEDKNSIDHLNLKDLSESNNFSLKVKNETLYIDNYSIINQQNVFKYPYSILRSLLIFYEYIIPVISVIGLLFFTVSTFFIFFKKHVLNPLWILSASLWTLTISRMVLLVLIDISSFPTMTDYSYFLPIYPILVLAAFLSIADMYNYINNKKLFN
jgi:hypothetical protein